MNETCMHIQYSLLYNCRWLPFCLIEHVVLVSISNALTWSLWWSKSTLYYKEVHAGLLFSFPCLLLSSGPLAGHVTVNNQYTHTGPGWERDSLVKLSGENLRAFWGKDQELQWQVKIKLLPLWLVPPPPPPSPPPPPHAQTTHFRLEWCILWYIHTHMCIWAHKKIPDWMAERWKLCSCMQRWSEKWTYSLYSKKKNPKTTQKENKLYSPYSPHPSIAHLERMTAFASRPGPASFLRGMAFGADADMLSGTSESPGLN